MPFKSDKQRAFLFANHPKIAEKWARKYQEGTSAVEPIAAAVGPPQVVLPTYDQAFEQYNQGQAAYDAAVAQNQATQAQYDSDLAAAISRNEGIQAQYQTDLTAANTARTAEQARYDDAYGLYSADQQAYQDSLQAQQNWRQQQEDIRNQYLRSSELTAPSLGTTGFVNLTPDHESAVDLDGVGTAYNLRGNERSPDYGAGLGALALLGQIPDVDLPNVDLPELNLPGLPDAPDLPDLPDAPNLPDLPDLPSFDVNPYINLPDFDWGEFNANFPDYDLGSVNWGGVNWEGFDFEGFNAEFPDIDIGSFGIPAWQVAGLPDLSAFIPDFDWDINFGDDFTAGEGFTIPDNVKRAAGLVGDTFELYGSLENALDNPNFRNTGELLDAVENLNQEFYTRTGNDDGFTRLLPESAVDTINVLGAGRSIDSFLSNPDAASAIDALEAADYLATLGGFGGETGSSTVVTDQVASAIGVESEALGATLAQIGNVLALGEVFEDGEIDSAGEAIAAANAWASISSATATVAPWLGPVGWAVLAFEVLDNYSAVERSVKSILRGDRDYKRVQGTGSWDGNRFSTNFSQQDGGSGGRRRRNRYNEAVPAAVNGLIDNYAFEFNQDAWNSYGRNLRLQSSSYYNRNGDQAYNAEDYVGRLIQNGVLTPTIGTPAGLDISAGLSTLNDYAHNNRGAYDDAFGQPTNAQRNQILQRQALDINNDGEWNRNEISDYLLSTENPPSWFDDQFDLDQSFIDSYREVGQYDLDRDLAISQAEINNILQDPNILTRDDIPEAFQDVFTDNVNTYLENRQYDLNGDLQITPEERAFALLEPEGRGQRTVSYQTRQANQYVDPARSTQYNRAEIRAQEERARAYYQDYFRNLGLFGGSFRLGPLW